MGMGDASNKDAPKVAIVDKNSADSDGNNEGDIHEHVDNCLVVRYWVNPGRSEVHPTLALTAAQAIGAACLTDGSV